jgi:hypothetical protein
MAKYKSGSEKSSVLTGGEAPSIVPKFMQSDNVYMGTVLVSMLAGYGYTMKEYTQARASWEKGKGEKHTEREVMVGTLKSMGAKNVDKTLDANIKGKGR